LMAFGLSGSLSACFMYIFALLCVFHWVANKDACLLAPCWSDLSHYRKLTRSTRSCSTQLLSVPRLSLFFGSGTFHISASRICITLRLSIPTFRFQL